MEKSKVNQKYPSFIPVSPINTQNKDLDSN